MKSSKVLRFPSCFSSTTAKPRPLLGTAGGLGCLHPDQPPAALLQARAHLRVPCNRRSNSFPLVSFHSTHWPHLSFPSKCSYTFFSSEFSNHSPTLYLLTYLFIYLLFSFFRAVPTTYGSSQARGQFAAAAAGLHHSHSNEEPNPYLRLIPQLMAMLDP